jgi:hypothetical protein
VIPALNEAANLGLVLGGLPPVHEVIVVDGGSADDTVRVARQACPHAVVLRQTRTGKGNALACGFAASRGDIVVTLNADGSADPGEIPRYVGALLAGAEVAHGSRYGEGGENLTGGRLERLGDAVLSRLVGAFFGTRLTDLSSGYNAYWRALLPALDLPGPQVAGLKRGRAAWGDGPEIEPLVNIRMAAQGLRVVEVASVGYPSIHGDDRRRLLSRAWRALRTLCAEYLRRRRSDGERTPGRHAAAVRTPASPAPRPQSLADPALPPPAAGRRAYPGPRPPWAGSVESGGGGAHRTQDITDYDRDAGRSGDGVYTTGVHRSGLYDTGVRRVGVYSSGVHRTEVYDTGAHRLPEDEDGPLYRQGALREVGGGRRRLDAQDRLPDDRHTR